MRSGNTLNNLRMQVANASAMATGQLSVSVVTLRELLADYDRIAKDYGETAQKLQDVVECCGRTADGVPALPGTTTWCADGMRPFAHTWIVVDQRERKTFDEHNEEHWSNVESAHKSIGEGMKSQRKRSGRSDLPL